LDVEVSTATIGIARATAARMNTGNRKLKTSTPCGSGALGSRCTLIDAMPT
jgi:hypothetical protein